ncbi:hypothetical protein [Streptomyces violascens]|uniref:Integral membrane protein n=1 Tax=Streptomyces violascens TaxID=67381 RepID=A0ABQ3R1V2_9ACTN|nr:hypothetical protein [Streptomyces violascens]GGU37274.1 hypothetical protein GCM10010289_67820 [Streptomyces violascens]GHI43510.1 hypothetical protein Sviol_79180 [Streptomyces violascens]
MKTLNSRIAKLWTTTVGGIGAVVVIASMVLIVGAFMTNSAAGESWQPAGTLGAIGLCVGATMVSVGVLGRSIVTKSGLR